MSRYTAKKKVVDNVALVDGEFMQATLGEFWMPDLEDRENLPIGESVKLIFAGNRVTERMWVKVTAQNGDGSYVGVLRNTPVRLPLEPGCLVRFEAKNVIQIHCEVECHVHM
jgi:hypothetical protein